MSYKHTIIYKPVCGNCGAVIHGEVSVDSGRLGHMYWSQVIQPCACENCGEVFETIIMPRPNDSNWSIDMDIDYTNVRGGQHE